MYDFVHDLLMHNNNLEYKQTEQLYNKFHAQFGLT
jgi:hypothetical protein